MDHHIAVLDDYQDAARSMADWSRLEQTSVVTFFHEHIEDAQTLAQAIGDCDTVVAMRERTRFDRALLDRLSRLRLLVTTGMRNAAIDLEACRERGIAVCGTESASAPAAELTWALLMALARHLPEENRAMGASGPWQRTVGRDLGASTLGLVGLGKIGTRVARVAKAFEMDVVAYSPHLTPERAQAAGARFAHTLEDLMRQSDFVSVHLVLAEETRGLVDAQAFAAMKPTALFINTARAGIVDQTAMIQALRERRIAGAGLDVFDVEPLPKDHPLLTLPNVLLTPHLGYVSEANYRMYYRQAVEDIEAFRQGSPVRRLV